MEIVNEVLNGIRIIKMFAWENSFLEKVETARASEVMQLKGYVISRSMISILWFALPTLVALFTFIIHVVVLKKKLTASTGYTALALFDLLRFPLVVLPDMIT